MRFADSLRKRLAGLSKRTNGKARPRRRDRTLQVEALERRDLLTAQPSLSIADANVIEGDTIQFLLTLS